MSQAESEFGEIDFAPQEGAIVYIGSDAPSVDLSKVIKDDYWADFDEVCEEYIPVTRSGREDAATKQGGNREGATRSPEDTPVESSVGNELTDKARDVASHFRDLIYRRRESNDREQGI